MPEFRDLAHKAGVDSYEALMRGALGERLSLEEDKELRKLTIGSGDSPKTFFLKRSWGLMRFSWMVKKWARLKWQHSRAHGEFNAVRQLADNGFSVMKPAAWGERMVCGIPTEGFLLVVEVKGRCAEDIWYDAAPPLRRRMMRDAGRLIGGLHRSGFLAFVRFKDLICPAIPDDADEPIEFVLIDRECSTDGPRRRTPKRCYGALAEGYFVLLRKSPEPSLRELLCFARSYLAHAGGYPRVSTRELLAGTAGETLKKFNSAAHRRQLSSSRYFKDI
jgi:hypothetical protein